MHKKFKLAVTQACQSVTQIRRSHMQWLEWLDDSRPAARSDLFGGYAKNVSELAASTSLSSGSILLIFHAEHFYQLKVFVKSNTVVTASDRQATKIFAQ